MATKLRIGVPGLWSDRRGSILPAFALAIVPVLGLIGAAVDYSRANAIKSALQAALDSTALAMASQAPTLSAADLRTQAQAYFNALFSKYGTTPVTLNVAYNTTDGGPQITISGTTNVATKFMRIPGLGINNVTVGGSASTAWGNTRLRVALVLDTTGSMESSDKMTALKTATKNLLTQLQGAATNNGDVYVSIIPFSKNVNVGAGNYNATWIDWTDWEAEPAVMSAWIANNQTTWEQTGPGASCPFGNSTHGFRCAAEPTSTSTVSYVPSSGVYAGYICPGADSGAKNATRIGIRYNGCYDSVASTRVIASGSGASCGTAVSCSCSGSGSSKSCTQTYFQHNWIKNSHSTWNGCVTDRGTSSAPSGYDYDRNVMPPGASADSKFPAEQNSYCSPEAMGLNYDWTGMKNLVDGLYPLGATNQPIGLVWGWQSLVGGGPFAAPARDPTYNYSEAIILMSDGLNTLDRWYGNGSSSSTSVDKRMYDTDGSGTCKNIKAAGITIYSIHVNTDGQPMSTLLKNCASGSDKFWMITSANQLVTVFSQIGTNLSRLRVAR